MMVDITPEKCGTCEGTGRVKQTVVGTHYDQCPTCHGAGKVYPAELVERIVDVLCAEYHNGVRQKAVAVLDALGETP